MSKNTDSSRFSVPIQSIEREIMLMDATLRDYFAVHASVDDIAAQLSILRSKCEILPDNYVSIARYMHADAMLEARK